MAFRPNWKHWTLLVGLLAVPARSADISPQTIEAGYLLQMPKFVTVGEPPQGLRSFCYYEKAGVPLEESVGQQVAKYVRAHPGEHLPVVRHFDAIRDLSGCDLFYIPADEEGNIDAILTDLGQSPVLTVSAAPRFILRGGMIGFTLDEDNRVKMEANIRNIKAHDIHVDAQLLEIMQRVIGQ